MWIVPGDVFYKTFLGTPIQFIFTIKQIYLMNMSNMVYVRQHIKNHHVSFPKRNVSSFINSINAISVLSSKA